VRARSVQSVMRSFAQLGQTKIRERRYTIILMNINIVVRNYFTRPRSNSFRSRSEIASALCVILYTLCQYGQAKLLCHRDHSGYDDLVIFVFIPHLLLVVSLIYLFKLLCGQLDLKSGQAERIALLCVDHGCISCLHKACTTNDYDE